MRSALKEFWKWYEEHYFLNLAVAGGLFMLQLIHLFWLATDVIAVKIFGTGIFDLRGVWEYIIVAVDYTEIPALITTSVLYLNEARKKANVKSVLFLFLINSQWLHLFWITDEFVIDALTGAGTLLPASLAWVAIVIDYLEVPIIADILKKISAAVREKRFTDVGQILKEK